ncbi:MAG: excinuclease ABC subunit UvrC [Rhodospirillaceae bacterium]|nr:excinuclease ABC subunit UvrC [Rhodospirillaceae bacterium]MBT4687131.1 excinuclease ABC subunit UvrC [Rhodospirillaceae bacterium]MBT5081321.1 excinuclease ABC subunit UvrC [Rhodospirillaceae bacterium]MBT5880960.1 excinuclease ABC subunit UvrC [Rhodospirillaceae bacterium]MBT6588636.1 excinuclease ABC subunit UvrC [Rhodospirillaceae bacterium]
MAKADKPTVQPPELPPDDRPVDGVDNVDNGGLDIGHGRDAIRKALETMPGAPGVYRMLARDGEVLYVGKAKNLKNRVRNYAQPAGLNTRTLRMIAETRAMEVVTTHTEVEALLLESNLIKRLRPRYNILLRDDKSFPFIIITGDHEWPQLAKHRGARNRKGEYFGPFASASSVNRTLNTLQKAFPLRSCSDSIFAARTRPCLQYQIRRCAGPCVGRIDADAYSELVKEARDFLSGRSREVQHGLSQRMEAASADLAFETAAVYRDRLRALAHVQAHQGINVASVGEADIVAIHMEGGQSCIQVFFFRAGQNWGNRAYFPSHGRETTPEEVLSAFLGQFYDDKPPPKEILLNTWPENHALIAEALSVKADRKVRLHCPKQGQRRELVNHAQTNAREALARRLAENASQRRLLEDIADLFALDSPPNRIEVYDNSHIMGTDAIGAMIVAGPEGMQKNAYRKFNIKDESITPGDDYGMMREVLHRRFARLLKAQAAAEAAEGSEEGEAATSSSENARVAGEWPDLVLIDGGIGQLTAVREVFADLGVTGVALAAISKGPDRNAGLEQLHLPDKPVISLPPRSAVLYFLQRLRDEAHRFAIGTHRARRAKRMDKSALDSIAGIGPGRKRALLNHFGSARAVETAGLTDLETVSGISKTVAQKIYDFFHPEG